MKKKFIAIGAVIGAIIIIAGLLMWENKQKKDADVLRENQSQIVNSSQNQEFPEDQLVWYEVPELGIKFKVTPDTKEDLGYSFKEYDNHDNSLTTGSVMFYSKAETDENLTGCGLSEETGWSCGWFDLKYQHKKEDVKKGLNYKSCEKSGGNDYVLDSSNNLCSFRDPSYGAGIVADNTYKDFFHIPQLMQDKKFGIYLNTIIKIQK